MSDVPKAKHIHLAKLKGLTCISLQSFHSGRVVKAMDFESEGSTCMFDSRNGRFIYFFFFMMIVVERRAAAQASAKRKRRCAGMSAANVGASSYYFCI